MRPQELDELCEQLFHGLPRAGNDEHAAESAGAVATAIATRTILPTTAPRRPDLPRKPRGRALSPWSLLSIAATGLLAVFCTFQGWTAHRSLTRPIEALRPGDKVLTNAPAAALLADGQDSAEVAATADLDPAQHRLVILRADVPWPDGTIDDYHIQTIQHVSWLAEHRIHVGGLSPIPLDLQEMEASDDLAARVVDIQPCPPIQSGPGRVVLTTVNHLNRDVLELTLRDSSGGEEKLRPTGRHRFYSVTRNTWLPAQDLRSGETLDGLTGPITVAALHCIPGTHRVYNLTVQGDHVYRVATSGVLVHNNYAPDSKVLQTGGHTITSRTRKALGLTQEEAKRAIEGLKGDLLQLPNHHQHKILDNGDVHDSNTGKFLGNLFDYLF